MLLNIKVPDETYEAYARRNPDDPRTEIERSLQAFATLDPRRVNLFLNQEELAKLGGYLGAPISTPEELLELVERSQRASFGDGLEIQLNAGQRARLKAMADFWHADFKKHAEDELKRGVVVVVGP